MLLALTGYEIGLLVVALVFIVFALVAALVVPRSRPAFPGRRLGIFIGVCIVLFLAQMGAVLALVELGHGETGEAEPTVTTPTEPEPTEPEPTEPEPTEPEPPEPEPTEPEPTEPDGDPVAGAAVFESAGCGTCHALADAGSTGTIGPSLDEVQPSYDAAVEVVTNGRGVMPPFADTLDEQEIRDVAAYVSTAAGS